MAPMQALLDLRLCAASCRALASPFSVASRNGSDLVLGVLVEEAAHLGHYIRVARLNLE